MDEVKSIFASKTVWGGIVALLAGVAGIFGYAIDTTLQTDLVNYITGIAATIGGAVAIYGRIMASKKVTTSGQS